MDGAPATAPEVQEAERRIAHVPLVLNRRNFNWLTQRISGVIEQPAPRWWWVCFMTTASIATFGLFALAIRFPPASAHGEIRSRSAGPGTSPTSFSGSVSDTPAH